MFKDEYGPVEGFSISYSSSPQDDTCFEAKLSKAIERNNHIINMGKVKAYSKKKSKSKHSNEMDEDFDEKKLQALSLGKLKQVFKVQDWKLRDKLNAMQARKLKMSSKNLESKQ